MNKYKLIKDIDSVIKGGCEKCNGECKKLIKGGCCQCKEKDNERKKSKFYINFDYESSDSEDEDDYNLKNIYNIGGSKRYAYRKKKYDVKVKKEKRQQSEGNKKWMAHVKEVKNDNPDLPYKQVLKLASQSY